MDVDSNSKTIGFFSFVKAKNKAFIALFEVCFYSFRMCFDVVVFYVFGEMFKFYDNPGIKMAGNFVLQNS